MTVQELIDELEKTEDRSLDVVIQGDEPAYSTIDKIIKARNKTSFPFTKEVIEIWIRV